MELCRDWSANLDRMPGKAPTLRVDGCVCFDESGWTVELTDHDGPQGINPRILMIDAVVTEQDDPVKTTVLIEVPVHYERQTETEYDQVHILVREHSEVSKLIDVVPTS